MSPWDARELVEYAENIWQSSPELFIALGTPSSSAPHFRREAVSTVNGEAFAVVFARTEKETAAMRSALEECLQRLNFTTARDSRPFPGDLARTAPLALRRGRLLPHVSTGRDPPKLPLDAVKRIEPPEPPVVCAAQTVVDDEEPACIWQPESPGTRIQRIAQERRISLGLLPLSDAGATTDSADAATAEWRVNNLRDARRRATVHIECNIASNRAGSHQSGADALPAESFFNCSQEYRRRATIQVSGDVSSGSSGHVQMSHAAGSFRRVVTNPAERGGLTLGRLCAGMFHSEGGVPSSAFRPFHSEALGAFPGARLQRDWVADTNMNCVKRPLAQPLETSGWTDNGSTEASSLADDSDCGEDDASPGTHIARAAAAHWLR